MVSGMDAMADDNGQGDPADVCTIRCTTACNETTFEPLVRFEIENYLPDSDARLVWDFPVDAAIRLAEMLAQSASAAIELAQRELGTERGGD